MGKRRVFLTFAAISGAVVVVCFALICKAPPNVPVLEFDESLDRRPFKFIWGNPSDPYLVGFRTRYGLKEIISGSKNDLERVERLCHWVHGLWKHNGRNVPTRWDPISIIEEARKGKGFRCVEYSTVLSCCLNAVGIPARTISLMTKDVETRKSGAGHVAVEAYLRDMGKWVFVDPQWDVIPCLGKTPLNAIELQRALAKRKRGLKVCGLSKVGAGRYFRWVSPYLYYFAVRLDSRVWVEDPSPEKLMLVPIGAREPKVFQRRFPIGDVVYTHSVSSFYPKPRP